MHDAHGGLAVDLDRDRDPVARVPVQVVRGPVDRVDDPADAGGRLGARALLGQHPVAGSLAPDPVDDQALAGLVDLGDHVGRRRLRAHAGARLAQALEREPGRLGGEVPGEGEQRLELGHALAPAVDRTTPGRRAIGVVLAANGLVARRAATPGPTCRRRARRSRPRGRSGVPSISTTPSPSIQRSGHDPEVVPAIGELAPEPQDLVAPAVEPAVGDGRRGVPFDLLGELGDRGLVVAAVEQLKAVSDALQATDRPILRCYRRRVAADMISFARGAPSADILPADAVREAAARALADDWERALSYGTGIGHPGLCEWIAELHGIDAGQVMVTNGSMEAAALLFRYMIEPGDRVIVEQPSYDRTLLLLGRTGAELVAGAARGRRRRRRRVRGGARRRAGEARPRDPQLPQPGRLHALGRQARAAGRARRRARLLDLRGRPLPADQVRRRRAAADDALDRTARTGSSTPRRSRRRSARASGSATWPGPPSRSRRSPSAAPRTTSRRTCSPSRSSSSSAAPARSTENIEVVNGALAERRDALVEALARADPGGRVRRPRRRLLPLARPRRRRRHRRRCWPPPRRRASPSSPAPTSCSRAAARACGSRSPASPPTASPRASRGSPRPSSVRAARDRRRA